LIKNLRQLKGYCTATRFLREFRTKNWTVDKSQILTILKRTVIQTYKSVK